ncbi:hypothetical protein ACCO45_013624 [Purpureocillium lilacinum]|uniref:Uncharacterized protein n=1 Tax=Purpureocillium lilacinum TaxID=33203 RepID=A0ACC4D6J6_PURLI
MCFEALDAHLTDRKPLSLDRLQASTAQGPQPPSRRRRHRLLLDVVVFLLQLLGLRVHAGHVDVVPPLGGAPASTPLFVTWNTVEDDGDTSLRGCIGTFEAQPLAVGIPEYAVISAVHDSRFPPVTRAELPELQAAVTLLTDFEEVDDPYDWEIGTHGIRLSFYDRGRRYGATYLPDVAAEQGWTQDETLFSLIRKAGWMGSRNKWKDLDLKVTRYQGKKHSMNHAEYKKWKAWAASNKQ